VLVQPQLAVDYTTCALNTHRSIRPAHPHGKHEGQPGVSKPGLAKIFLYRPLIRGEVWLYDFVANE
jgi:hypothetical protein